MPANTTRGYPYPLPTEPVAEGAQAIRNLADAIDAKSAMDLLFSQVCNGTASPGFGAPVTVPSIYRSLRCQGKFRNPNPADADVWFRINNISTNSYWTQQHWSFATTVSAANTGYTSIAKCGGAPGTTNGGWGAFTLELPLIQVAGAPMMWTSQAASWTSSGAICFNYAGLGPAGPVTLFGLGSGNFLVGEFAVYGIR